MSLSSLSERLRAIKETISEFRFECVEFEHQLKSVFDDLDGLRRQFEWRCRQVSQIQSNDDSMLHIANSSNSAVDA